MKVLVTGGGGFVGMALVRRLLEEGWEVSVFSRKRYPEHQQTGIDVHQGDITRYEEIGKACRGMEAVFHVAAKVGIWGSYADFYVVNVRGTENVIRACLANRVGKLIFTSSASVVFDGRDMEGVDESMPYPEKPISPYTATKAEAEKLVLRANSEKLKTIVLRPHLIVGPGDTQLIPRIIERARKGRVFLPGKRNCTMDYVSIDNLIQAQMLALKKMDANPAVCGRPFFITNGNPVPIKEFLNDVIQSAGLAPVEKSVPETVAYAGAWILEKTHLLFRLKGEPYFTRFLIKELCTHHWFDITAALKMLGYTP